MGFAQHKKILIGILAVAAVGILMVSAPKQENEETVVDLGLDSEEVASTLLLDEDVPATDPLPAFPIEQFAADPRIQDLEAGAVYVEWLTHKLPLFELRADVPLPLASLTKIMTAYAALEEVGEDAVITVTPDAVAQPGDHGQTDGMTYTLREALTYALALSSNDAAYAIQESVSQYMTGELPAGRGVAINSFVRRMNDYADELGLAQTYFVDAVGFDESEQLSGSYGTAREVSRLMVAAHARYPRGISSASITPRIQVGERTFQNTNPLVETEDIMFSKTGFTDLAGGNLAVLVDTTAGPVSIVVLRSSFEGRIADVELLIRIFEDWYGNYVITDSVY